MRDRKDSLRPSAQIVLRVLVSLLSQRSVTRSVSMVVIRGLVVR